MITNKILSLLLNASTALVLNVLPAQADNHLPAWAFGGFERPEGVNHNKYTRTYIIDIYTYTQKSLHTHHPHVKKWIVFQN